MVQLFPDTMQHAGFEREFSGARLADLQVFFDQPGFLGAQPSVEEIVQPPKRLIAGLAGQFIRG